MSDTNASTPCERCTIDLAPEALQCPHCGWPGRYPNVNFARREREALQKRYREEVDKAQARGAGDAVQQFEAAVARSHAVMCVKANEAHRLVFAEGELKATYYATADTRFPRAEPPSGTDWNRIREAVDGVLFTDSVKWHIRFAALAMTGEGLTAYGPCTLVCKTSMIEHRASAFEKNSCQFFIDRGGIAFTSGTAAITIDLTEGYRSTWDDRSKLCVAKLAERLASGMNDDDFGEVLMTRGASTSDDEYVEVHICGPISLRTLAGVAIHENAPTAVGYRGILADLRDRLEAHDFLIQKTI